MNDTIHKVPDTYAYGNLPRFHVLRAIAILGVFYFHYSQYFARELNFNPNTHVLNVHNQPSSAFFFTFSPTAFGGSGVKLFFIISGFLIHHSFLRSGRKKLNFRSYIARRFWRIYPPYLLVLLFFSLFDKHLVERLFNTEQGLISFVSHVLLLHNLSNSTLFDINSSFWSLALEWQFYLLYSLFLWIRSQVGIRKATLILLGIYPVFMGCMGLWYADFLANPALILSVIPTWGMWALGAWMAENYSNGNRTFSISTPALVGLILLYMAGRYFWVWQYACHLWEALIWAMITDRYIDQSDKKLVWWEKALIPIGLCSYSFYLIHQPLVLYLNNYITTPGLADRFLTSNLVDSIPVLAIIFLISYSLYQFVELPAIALGKRLQKRPKRHEVLENTY